MKYSVQIFVYFLIQHLPFIGSVTIDFNSIGYIGERFVLQCHDTPPIAVPSADWYRGGSLMDISSSRYTQTTTPTGFNLTISSLVKADAGVYKCGIDFGISAQKSLTIYYNTEDVNITKLIYPKAIEITFIAFPDPKYVATVKQDGVLLDVNWNVNKSTLASGAIKVSLQNSTAFTNQNIICTVHVNISSPVSLVVERDIIWVSDLTTQKTDESALESFQRVSLSNVVILVICLIFNVILLKSVKIEDKDELQKPILEGSEVSITAFVCGFCISRVQWIGPHGDILTSNKKYNIITYNTGISTLQISSLVIHDRGLYTCRAIGLCRSSAQDSVRITVYEKLAVVIDIKETLRHGSHVKVICSVYGSEKKTVDWFRQEDNTLTNGGRYTNASYDSNTINSSPIIRTRTMSNAEDHICQVAFKESEVSVKIYIKVYKIVLGLLKASIKKIILFVPASENESRIWIGPQENSSTDIGKYTIVPYDSNSKQSHLTIKTFSMNDNGSFTCQPSNSSGTSPKYSITITTNGKPCEPQLGLERCLWNTIVSCNTVLVTLVQKCAKNLILRLGLSIICVASIVCIMNRVMIGNPCAPELGLGLGVCIPFVGFIVIVILVKRYATYQKQGSRECILGVGFSTICIACIVFTMILIGQQCALKLDLGHTLGLIIPFLGCIIVIVILVNKALQQPPTPDQPENRRVKSGIGSEYTEESKELNSTL